MEEDIPPRESLSLSWLAWHEWLALISLIGAFWTAFNVAVGVGVRGGDTHFFIQGRVMVHEALEVLLILVPV